MSWRDDEDEAPTPANFLGELYSDEEELYDVTGYGEVSEDSEDEIEAPPYSPLYSPEHWSEEPDVGDNRDRSRSPILRDPASDVHPSSLSNVIICIYDDEERPLDDVDFNLDENMFLDPDEHALYVNCDNMEEMNVHNWKESKGVSRDRNTCESRVRARVQNRRRVRVSGRGRARRGFGRRRYHLGSEQLKRAVNHPIEEIWISDDDVPAELKDLIKDLMMRRELKAQKMRDRAVRNVRERETEEKENESEAEDEFQDATDESGNPLLESEDIAFHWSSMDTYRPQEEVFTPQRTGSVNMYLTPYDAFRSYWDDDIMKYIVNATNQNALKIQSDSFQKEWQPTNVHEVMCLFAFWIMLGIIQMPTIRSCFSTDPLLKTEIFRKMFTCSRLEALSRALHFGDNVTDSSKINPLGSSGLAYNLGHIISHLNKKFQENYVPSKNICIDESLTPWKGKLNFKQYIRAKAARLGIKTFELCESATGYLWSFIVYRGKQTVEDATPFELKSTGVIKKLMAPLLNKGYRLFMDSWFNSPHVARFLKRNGTDLVGTLRPTSKDVPILINKAPLKRGQLIARHSGDVCVLSWQHMKRVTMISTCHGSDAGLARVPSTRLPRSMDFKPQVVLDYNRSMGGVDLKDQMLEPYLLERKKSIKWHMKLFKRLLNVSILNARILIESSLQSRQDHLNFRLELVDKILYTHLSLCPLSRKNVVKFTKFPISCRKVPFVHWPVHLGELLCESSNRRIRQRCHVCVNSGRLRKKTTFKCEYCDVPLCVNNCFKEYHLT